MLLWPCVLLPVYIYGGFLVPSILNSWLNVFYFGSILLGTALKSHYIPHTHVVDNAVIREQFNIPWCVSCNCSPANVLRGGLQQQEIWHPQWLRRRCLHQTKKRALSRVCHNWSAMSATAQASKAARSFPVRGGWTPAVRILIRYRPPPNPLSFPSRRRKLLLVQWSVDAFSPTSSRRQTGRWRVFVYDAPQKPAKRAAASASSGVASTNETLN